ncbi:MAG: hypothetical protein ACRDGV_10095 [Candidatus Limnocylindria bacterium]
MDHPPDRDLIDDIARSHVPGRRVPAGRSTDAEEGENERENDTRREESPPDDAFDDDPPA